MKTCSKPVHSIYIFVSALFLLFNPLLPEWAFSGEASLQEREDPVEDSALPGTDRGLLVQGPLPFSPDTESGPPPEGEEEFPPLEAEEEIPADETPDPLESINRIFFRFNDRLYFWVMKPAAKGYRAVVPEGIRIGVRNIFDNAAFPVRFLNCLLQAKFQGAGVEVLRFVVNTTAGMGGFVDVASDSPTMRDLSRYDEDLGQTLGLYGLGPGIYINWPILGPSSIRDTLGLVGDAFINPQSYIPSETEYNASVRAYEGVNDTSLRIGEYEDLIDAALDPYIAVRNAYFQYRKAQIKK